MEKLLLSPWMWVWLLAEVVVMVWIAFEPILFHRPPRRLKRYEEREEWEKAHARKCARCAAERRRVDLGVADLRRHRDEVLAMRELRKIAPLTLSDELLVEGLV